MLKFLALSNVIALLSLANAGIINPRSIVRSNEKGIVNLVEYTVGGINHGLCSYRNQNDEQITVVYEEVGEILYAKSSSSNSEPVVETHQCRSAALNYPPQGRPNVNKENSHNENNLKFLKMFDDFQQKVASIQPYITQLSPRLINFVPVGTKPTKNGIFDKFLFLFNGASLSTVDVPFPVWNLPKPFG